MTGTWPSGWATGDLTLAAQYAKGMGAISDTTLGGSAASVNVTSIVATYAHLLVVVYARADNAAASINLGLRFNGDTAANYDSQQLQGAAAAVGSSELFAQTTISAGVLPANTAGANLFGVSMIFVPHYAGSSNNKLALTIASTKTGTTSGSVQANLFGGFWRSSAAINQITLLAGGAGNLVTGTRVTIYGMGA